jgi:hypothetical protein
MNSAWQKNETNQIRFMKKLLVLSAAAALLAVQSATAVPTLTLSDGTTSVTITDGGAGDLNAAAGAIVFIGTVGGWTINTTTGLASPPLSGGTPSQPTLDLNSVNKYTGSTASTLTITFTMDNVGPISGNLKQKTGGTQTGLTSVEFLSQVNGSTVTDGSSTVSPFAITQNGGVSAGTGSTISIVAVLNAAGGEGLVSFDSEVTVPDAGMTLALLGCGLTGLALFGRSRKAA